MIESYPDNQLDMDEAVYGSACQIMVEEQLRRRGIVDEDVLKVMRQVPRHLFVAPQYQHRAYSDCALPTINGQTISQPFMVALMTQCLALETGKERVLEVGTGSAYQTLILARLVPEGEISSVERDKDLVADALQQMEYFEVDHVSLYHGDGCLGLGEDATFDRILVTAGACAECPYGLYRALKTGGMMVIPMGDREGQHLMLFKKGAQPEQDEWQRGLACRFVPLIGKSAWPDPQ